jgi:hypothetical protein
MENLIIQAKLLLEKLKVKEEEVFKIQMKIADMALAYCGIAKGKNQFSENTQADFARAIGMKPNTLADWILAIRTVVPIVGKENISSKKDWVNTRRIADSFRKENPSPEKIKKDFQSLKKKEIPLEMEFKEIKRYIYKLEDFLKKEDITPLPYQELLDLEYCLDECSERIDDHLKARKKSQIASIH